MVLLPLLGCMSLDSFFFNALPVSAYTLASDVIPPELLEEVTFETEDGLTLYGVWAHQPAGGAQTFLHFHGNAENIDAYMDRFDIYWELGFETFFFDYRGYGKSQGTPTFDGILLDGEAAIAYVEDHQGLASEDLVFHGLSLGGAVAVHNARDFPPKVLITEDMFASGGKIVDDSSGLGLPPGWFLADELDNASAAADVHVPYLITHGLADDFVRPDAADTVYAQANDPKRLWLVPEANHADTPMTDPEGYRANLLCWTEQTCPEEPG